MISDGGQVVYNLPSWGYGFSTAIMLKGDYDAAVNYVTKYVTKTEGKVGGRWYYHGGSLEMPTVALCNTNYEEFSGGWETVIDGLGAKLRIVDRSDKLSDLSDSRSDFTL